PLSTMRSAPTTERAMWRFTPAAASAASRLRVDLSKNSITAASSQDGEFVTSTTTFAPARAPARPSPVTVLTPEEGDAATTSWPFLRRLSTSFLPISPLPPITTIFMFDLLECGPGTGAVHRFPPWTSGPRAARVPLLFLLLADDEVLGLLRVQDDGDEA